MRDPLEVAAQIGARLAKTAQWDGDTCAWVFDDRMKSRARPVQWQLDGSIYRGSAGIALFLAELYASSGDRKILAAARGALAHASRHTNPAVLPWSVFSGALGVAFVYDRLWLATRSDADASKSRLWWEHTFNAPLVPGDVITGAAGAVPVVLRLTQAPPEQKALAVRRLVATLASSAIQGMWGAAWPGGTTSARPLTGFAHGTSGYAYGLLAAWLHDGDSAAFYLLHQSLLYETHSFDHVLNGWPDFRHSAYAHVAFEISPEELRDRVLAGWNPGDYQPHAMTAWCHGPPGIGPVRLAALEHLQYPWLRAEAEFAADQTAETFRERQVPSWSLCHGAAGNAEFLLQSARVLGRRDDRELALAIAAEGYDRFESRGMPWPSGAAEHVPVSSLLLGDAGIGLFYLRLHDSSITSILFPQLPTIPRRPDETDVSEYRQRLFERLLPQSTAVLMSSGDRSLHRIIGPWSPQTPEPDVAVVVRRVSRTAATSPNTSIREAAWRDAQALRTGIEMHDGVRAALDDMTTLPLDDIDWGSTRLTLRANVVLRARHARGAATAADSGVPQSVVVRTAGPDSIAEPLTPLSWLVLSAYRTPTTVAGAARKLRRRLSLPADQIVDLVQKQSQAAYQAGLLTCAFGAK